MAQRHIQLYTGQEGNVGRSDVLTFSRVKKVGTSDIPDRDAIAQTSNIEGDDEPPVVVQCRQPVNQLFEKVQKAELDSHDAGPS